MPHTADTLHPTRPPIFAIFLASVLLLGLAAGGFWAASQVAMVPSAVPAYMAVEDTEENVSLSSNTHASQLRISSSGPIWREITEAQRQVLMPLRERWDSMGALAKRRWLVLADRYPQMDESERTKLVTRMNTWASLSVQQRNQARLNFESTRRLSAKELQEKWDAYQALSAAEKKRLVEQANKAKAAKKSKRKLARIPTPKTKPAAPATPRVPAPPPVTAPATATPHAVPSPAVTVTLPVATPQATPTAQIPPLDSSHSSAPVSPPAEVATQPVQVPFAAPTMDLLPLDTPAPNTPPTSATGADPSQPPATQSHPASSAPSPAEPATPIQPQ